MSDEWIGVIHSTRPKYMKGASDMTLRKRLFFAMLRKEGRITYNNSGDEFKWQVEFSQPSVTQHGDGSMIDFSNHDAFRQATLDWRGYVATDSMTMKQREMNKGQEALINLFQTKQKRLMKSIDNKFAGECYKDGNATGRENSVHGLESFFDDRTTCAASDELAEPGDTYGGLNTNLADQGGTWSANGSSYPNATLAKDWPDGQGDSEYDYYAPKLVNWSSTGWGTGSTTFEDNCWRVIGQTITWLTISGGDDGFPKLCLLASNLFQSYKNHEEAIRRINVPHKAANDLGFEGNVLNQDGTAISADYDVPYNTGYMMNISNIEIASLMPELFWMQGPDRDPRTAWSYLWGCGFYGNLRVDSPKYFAKLYNYA
jgi:hypothetical protein